jgi:hypothetical protein
MKARQSESEKPLELPAAPQVSANTPGPVVITEALNHFLVRVPSSQGERARRIPGRQWDGDRKMWVFPKDISTYEALDAEFKAGAEVFAIRRPEVGRNRQQTSHATIAMATQVHAPKTEEEFEEQLTVVVQQEPEQDQPLESLRRLILGVQEGMVAQQRILEAVLQKQEEMFTSITELETPPQSRSKEIRIVKELPDLLDFTRAGDLKLLEKALIGVAFFTCARDQSFINWVVKQRPLLAPFDFVCKTHEFVKQQLEKIAGYGGPETKFWELVDRIRAEGLIFCDRHDSIQVFHILGSMNSLRNQFTHQRSDIGEAEKMTRSILYLMNLALVWRRVMVDEDEPEIANKIEKDT